MSCSEWKIIKFEESGLEIEDGDRGKNYPKKSELLSQGYCPFLNNKNILDDKINFDEVEFITKQKDELLRKGKIKVGDIVLTTRGSVGNVGLFHENLRFKQARINSGMVIIRDNNEIFDINYLYQLLKSPYMKQQYKSMSTGTAQPQLPIKDIKKLNLIVPPLEEQEKISGILSSLDNKIELNNKMNKTLEEVAQSIFKRWFVDFEFPNEDGLPYKSSGGEMVESELGMIPKGWEVKTIADIGEVISGGTPSTKNEDYYGGDISWITPKDLSGYDRKFITKGERSITELGLQKSSAKLLPKGTVLFSSRAPIGYVAISDKEVCTNQGFKSIVCNTEIMNNNYVYYFLKFNKKNIENVSSGSTFKEISGTHMKNFKIIVPNKDILDNFNKIIISYDGVLSKNYEEIDNLTEIKDTLLTKLMNGEIILNN